MPCALFEQGIRHKLKGTRQAQGTGPKAQGRHKAWVQRHKAGTRHGSKGTRHAQGTHKAQILCLRQGKGKDYALRTTALVSLRRL